RSGIGLNWSSFRTSAEQTSVATRQSLKSASLRKSRVPQSVEAAIVISALLGVPEAPVDVEPVVAGELAGAGELMTAGARPGGGGGARGCRGTGGRWAGAGRGAGAGGSCRRGGGGRSGGRAAAGGECRSKTSGRSCQQQRSQESAAGAACWGNPRRHH